MNIDWSKAPEGTTHYGPQTEDFNKHWFRVELAIAGWSMWHDGKWISVGALNKERFDTLVSRPSEWAGECPPPIGTECEFRTTQGRVISQFEKVRVQYLSEYTFVGLRLNPENGVETELICHPATAKFRPIRTAEQIAAEEKQNAWLAGIAAEYDQETADKCAAVLVTGGYRKQVPE